jgi:hypothetical protein
VLLCPVFDASEAQPKALLSKPSVLLKSAVSPHATLLLPVGQGKSGNNDARASRVAQPLARRRDRVYDEAGNVIETNEQAGEFREW